LVLATLLDALDMDSPSLVGAILAFQALTERVQRLPRPDRSWLERVIRLSEKHRKVSEAARRYSLITGRRLE
jgi:hypothetical protein